MDFSDIPNQMNAPNGKPRFAYVTFVMLNDNYLPGALVAGFSLRKQSTQAELVCLVTDGVSLPARLALESLFDHVPKVEPIFLPHKRRQQRQDRPYFFTRIHSLRLGTDGDLGYGFDKIVVIDADLLPLKYCDHLFCLPAPAGVLNETKSHVIQNDKEGNYKVTKKILKSGRWEWHRRYDPICPHGFPVPSEITDRVAKDPTNMGMNGALFVLEPSSSEYEKILSDVQRPVIQRLVGDVFDWPDMQYLTMRWSGKWTNIDARFSGMNGYPHPSVLFATHYAGFKPWYIHRVNAMKRYARYPDFQHWFQMYVEMVEGNPKFLEIGKLRRLTVRISDFLQNKKSPSKLIMDGL